MCPIKNQVSHNNVPLPKKKNIMRILHYETHPSLATPGNKPNTCRFQYFWLDGVILWSRRQPVFLENDRSF